MGAALPEGLYRGEINYDVKGSVPVLFWNLHHIGEREKKEGVQTPEQSTQNC